MRTLARYLGLRFLLVALGTIAVLTALLQIVDLLDTTADILGMGEGARGFLFYLAMRTPMILPEVTPLGVLIAGLFVFAPLVRNGEVVAMRAAGLRIEQILLAFLPALVAIAAGHYLVSDHLRPPAERQLAEWWADNGTEAGKPVWLRVDGTLVEVGRVRDGGRRLDNLRIFAREDDGVAVTTATTASAARFVNDRWFLDDAVATNWRRAEIGEGRPVDGAWATTLEPRDVVEAMTPDANVSARVAYDVLVGRRLAVAAPSFYAVALQRAFAEPLVDGLMLLIAAPLLFVSWREARGGGRMIAALGCGLFFLLADGIVAALGRAGLVPAAIAAWAPVLLAALLAYSYLRRLDRGRAGNRP